MTKPTTVTLPSAPTPATGSPVNPGADAAPGGEAAGSSQATVWLFAKTKKIYPRAVSGVFAAWRWGLVWFTQILFYGVPWLMWNDRQAVLFDLGARRFYIGGLVLYPQDFIYLTGLLIISAYGLFLFTAVAGRLWCGYACPQTVYTEIFLWIERKFEGDRQKRMKLDAGPWTLEKWLRKSGKQLSWVLLSLWTGFTFVGYFTPIHSLAGETLASLGLGAAAQAGLGPWELFWILFYGFATYGFAGHMREQVCKYMCPYARFQSAMFDKDTLIISYDTQRGDPRGARNKKVDPKAAGLGDCVDCGLCVQVCPTGIDIRNGLQYECIGCAACVDVCDGVMDKMGYARGLVGYATENSLANRWLPAQMIRRALRPRVLIYTAILCLIIVVMGVSLSLRSPFRVDVVRDRSALARIVDEGRVENVYRLQVMNATESVQRYRIRVRGKEAGQLPGLQVRDADTLQLGPAEARWVSLGVQLPAEVAAAAGTGVHPIVFEIDRLGAESQAPVRLEEKSTFMVPR